MDWWFILEVGIGAFGGIWALLSLCGAVVVAPRLFDKWWHETWVERVQTVMAYLIVIIFYPFFFVANTAT